MLYSSSVLQGSLGDFVISFMVLSSRTLSLVQVFKALKLYPAALPIAPRTAQVTMQTSSFTNVHRFVIHVNPLSQLQSAAEFGPDLLGEPTSVSLKARHTRGEKGRS